MSSAPCSFRARLAWIWLTHVLGSTGEDRNVGQSYSSSINSVMKVSVGSGCIIKGEIWGDRERQV